MCKFIKDILFPLNVLGKKKRTFKIDVPAASGTYPFDFYWEGERLEIAWAYEIQIKTPGQRRHFVEQHKEIYTDGDIEQAHHIDIVQLNNISTWQTANGYIYLNCTNVTYLGMNGTILIGE